MALELVVFAIEVGGTHILAFPNAETNTAPSSQLCNTLARIRKAGKNGKFHRLI